MARHPTYQRLVSAVGWAGTVLNTTADRLDAVLSTSDPELGLNLRKHKGTRNIVRDDFIVWMFEGEMMLDRSPELAMDRVAGKLAAAARAMGGGVGELSEPDHVDNVLWTHWLHWLRRVAEW